MRLVIKLVTCSLLLALVAAGKPEPTSEEAKPVIMVAEVRLVGVSNPQNLQTSLMNRIISAVNATGQYQTTDPDATRRAMQKAGEYLSKGDCYSFETCKGVHEVGKALGANLMITATVTWYPEDQFYDISLKLTHIFLFTNPASISHNSQGKSFQNLMVAIEQATYQLLGSQGSANGQPPIEASVKNPPITKGEQVNSSISSPKPATPSIETQGGEKSITLNDILKLHDQGISETLIIGMIQSSRQVFSLSADDIILLQRKKISQNIINALVLSGSSDNLSSGKTASNIKVSMKAKLIDNTGLGLSTPKEFIKNIIGGRYKGTYYEYKIAWKVSKECSDNNIVDQEEHKFVSQKDEYQYGPLGANTYCIDVKILKADSPPPWAGAAEKKYVQQWIPQATYRKELKLDTSSMKQILLNLEIQSKNNGLQIKEVL